MKKKYFLPIVLVAMLATGCTKEFLDRKPLDSVDDSNFWTNEENLRMHSIYYYAQYFKGYYTAYNPTMILMSSYCTDVRVVSGGTNGGLSNGNSSGGPSAGYNSGSASYLNECSWGDNYIWIRRANTFINRLDRDTKAALADNVYRHWMGVARYLRAQRYVDLVWGWGDVPYFDQIPPSDLEGLCKNRDDRYMILDKCIEDFQYAVDNCYDNDGGNNMLNRYSIAAFGARWFYWLGCFQKYVPAEYAGGNMTAAAKYLNKAVEWAGVVINSGRYQIDGDYRKQFTQENLSSSKEAIFARHYDNGQSTNSAVSYFGNMADSQGWGGAPSANFMRNVILFWDGTLQPEETTVLDEQGITTTDAADKYDKLYTMEDNALLKNKDSRLEAMLKSSRKITSATDNNTGAMSAEYISSSNTRYFVRICFPREYEDYGRAAALAVTKLQGASNIIDAPIIRYSHVLLDWIAAKAELADGLGGAAVTQADLDASVELVRNRPVATGGTNPSIQPNRLPKLTLGQYPTDPERDLEGFTTDAKKLIWEIRRERTVELFNDWVRNRDLRAYGQLLAYQYRYDSYAGKYNNEPARPIDNYQGQYQGGNPTTGWGNTDPKNVPYFQNNPEGNLLQCGAYINLASLHARYMDQLAAVAAESDPDAKAALKAQANEYLVSLNTVLAFSPGLWVVTPEGEQRLFPDYKLQDDGSFKKKTAYTDAAYTVTVDPAEYQPQLDRIKGWIIVGRGDQRSSASQVRSWLACVPISQIIYYRDRGYELTQNPGYATEL